MTPSASFRLTSSLEELPGLAESIEAFADAHQLAPRAILELQVVLDEIVVNITRHGYGGESGKPINVELLLTTGMLEVRIEDEAAPFDPLTVPEPDLSRPAEQRPPGGLGVYLIRRLMDDVHYERKNDKNLLLLRKRV